MQFNTEEINQLIHTRRSIFPADYTGKKIDEAVIQQILDNAICAPTHKQTEPWRFVVFVNDGISRLAEFQAACYKSVTTADGTFREERFKGLQTTRGRAENLQVRRHR